MLSCPARLSLVAAGILANAIVALPGAAWAQGGSAPAPARSANPGPTSPSAPGRALAPSAKRPSGEGDSLLISREQLDSFAQLLGEDVPVVWQRLLLDPGLVPFATAAADARIERRRTGKVMTITGFTILGVGVIGGYILFLSGYADLFCWDDSSCSGQAGRKMLGGLVIMLASTGIGLGIGIPGIISITRQTEVETAAVERYQYPGYQGVPMPYAPPVQSLLSPGKTLRLPLLSFTF
jgi:hypothetical protein